MNNPKILIEIKNGVLTITSTEKNIDIWVADHDSPTSDDLFTYQDNEPDKVISLKEFREKLDRIEDEHKFPIYPKSLVKEAKDYLKTNKL